MSGRKGWCRVDSAVGHEPWSNDLVATYVRLIAHMIDRWARDGKTAKEAETVQIHNRDLCRITGKGNIAYARRAIRDLADISEISLRYIGDIVEITWPKFAEFQRLRDRTRAESADADASPLSPPNGGTKTARKRRAQTVLRAVEELAASEARKGEPR